MAVPAIAPGLLPAMSLRDVATPSLVRGSDPAMSRMPDVVVFSSAPFRLLADLATSGLRQLATLLPVLERAAAESDPAPLGFLAKAAGAAAKQISEGHVALLAAGPDRLSAALREAKSTSTGAGEGVPQSLRALARQLGATGTPPRTDVASSALRAIAREIGAAPPAELSAPKAADPAEHWLAEAKHILRRTGEVLEQAASTDRSEPVVDLPSQPTMAPQLSWVALEIAAAQAQVRAAVIGLEQTPLPRRAATDPVASPRLMAGLSNAVGLLGLALVVFLLGVASGAWSLAALTLAIGGTVWWAWRFMRAGRGLTLDVSR